jgi:hypothetical protein
MRNATMSGCRSMLGVDEVTVAHLLLAADGLGQAVTVHPLVPYGPPPTGRLSGRFGDALQVQAWYVRSIVADRLDDRLAVESQRVRSAP